MKSKANSNNLLKNIQKISENIKKLKKKKFKNILKKNEIEPYKCLDGKIDHNFSIIPKKSKKKYAYVTLLMLGDSYLPGVLVCGYCLKLQNTKYDLVVLITSDVSKDAIKALRIIYDKIVKVKYIIPNREAIFPHLLEEFPHYLQTFTKLNLFNLTQYEKVLFLDADSIPLKNFDHLFTLNAPAGILYDYHNMNENNYLPRKKGDRYIWHQKYCECCDHGKKIPKKMTDVAGKGDKAYRGMSVELMIQKPSKKDFKKMVKYITNKNYKGPYFLSDSGFITYYFSGKWTGIDPRFLGRRGYPNIEQLFGIALGGDKPWEINNIGKWIDFEIWNYFFINMLKDNKKLLKNKLIYNLYKNIKK